MRKTVVDRCPDASSARERLYVARIDRALGRYGTRIDAVHLEIAREDARESVAFWAQLTVDLQDGSWLRAETRRPALPVALGAVFGGVVAKLRRGSGGTSDVVVHAGERTTGRRRS